MQIQPQGTAAVINAGLVKTTGNVHTPSVVAAEVLVEKVATSLCVLEENFGTSHPVAALSIESLTAVEIRHWFAIELKSDVPESVVLGNECIGELGKS